MPYPKVQSNTHQNDQIGQDDGDERTTSYHSEESISAAIVSKFLSNIGVNITDIKVKILPWEHDVNMKEFDKLPTLMFNLTHIKLYKNSLTKPDDHNAGNSEVDFEEFKDIESVGDGRLSQRDSSLTVVNEEKTPDIIHILKNKVIEFGQFTIQLLPSPFNLDNSVEPEGSSLEWDVNKTQTILCCGHPNSLTIPWLKLSLSMVDQSLSNEVGRLKIDWVLDWIDIILDPLQLKVLQVLSTQINMITSKVITVEGDEYDTIPHKIIRNIG